MSEKPAWHYSWWQRQPVDVRDWPVLLNATSQLFVDDHLIAGKENIGRQFHEAERHDRNPVLAPEHPWEGTACMAHGTVVQEPSGRLRMYYTGYVGGMPFEDPLANPLCLHCVAYSGDGLHWEKPGLGLYPYQGRTDTNMVLPCRPEVTRYDQMSVIYDARDPDPTRRWKMGVKHSGKGLFVNDPADPRHALIGPGPYEGAGYYAYFSEDGLRWRQHPEPIMTDGWSLRREEWPLRGVAENQSVMFDSVRNKFVAFVRIWDCRTGQPGVWRARAICESDDFIHWTTPRVLFLPLEDDEPGLQFYSSNGWNYESMYLGLLRCYRFGSTHQVYFQLVSSRDGIHWERAADRRPFIPNGSQGAVDGGYHSDFSNPPIRMGDELWFYYGSTQFGKNVRPYIGGICLAKLRVDGFASMEGGVRTGSLVTRPLDFSGKTVTINVAPRTGGSVVVEALDRHGGAIAGFGSQDALPVTGDGISVSVRWRDPADLAALQGRTVRLKFYLTNAGLYSFAIR
ncbi:MAG: hypothetical protein KAJ05_11005 [Candidatus Latescibacteria bacterium]|nr:hypothetical protein [Candidatus Latescibacterota bacterium]